MTNTDPARTDPLVLLWLIARKWIAEAARAYSAPGEIARMLTRAARAALKRRIKALEMLVMKLLLIEASRLRANVPRASGLRTANARTVAANRTAAAWKPAARPFDPARPETWRVRFMLRIPSAPRDRGTPPARSAPRVRDLGRPLLVRDLWRERARAALIAQLARAREARYFPDLERERAKCQALARRFEALLRAAANPAPHARRLLRKLEAFVRDAYCAAQRLAMRRVPRNELNRDVLQRVAVDASAAAAFLLPPAGVDSS